MDSLIMSYWIKWIIANSKFNRTIRLLEYTHTYELLSLYDAIFLWHIYPQFDHLWIFKWRKQNIKNHLPGAWRQPWDTHRSGVAMINVSHRKWTILDVNTCSVPPPKKNNIEIFWFQEPSFVGWNAFRKMVNPLRMTMATIPNWIYNIYVYILTGIYGGFFKCRYPQMVGL